jgi:hypothetical protein
MPVVSAVGALQVPCPYRAGVLRLRFECALEITQSYNYQPVTGTYREITWADAGRNIGVTFIVIIALLSRTALTPDY